MRSMIYAATAAESSATALLVFLSIRCLPPGIARPACIVRLPGRTLIVVDPRETRRAITEWNVSVLTREENCAYRAAYGLPPVDHDTPDWILDDGPALLYVPPLLRLKGEPALQGGRELKRRRAEKSLDVEQAMYRAELGERAWMRLAGSEG